MSLLELRRELHMYPELSHGEEKTAARMLHWLRDTGPDHLIEKIGGHGLAAVWDSGKPGKSVLFRCELDGLPVREYSNLPYRSVYENRGHLCGHDGHMAILAGMASHLKNNRPRSGKVILLFQPAEETGEGAELVLNDERFLALEPEYAFALHNLPGFGRNSLILAERHFSSASAGLEIRLEGKSSHAAEPENGINPALAVARIIKSFHDLIKAKDYFSDFILLTIIQIVLGEKAFGTSPGEAVLRGTLRAFTEPDMERLKEESLRIAYEIARAEGLKMTHRWTEVFPATLNYKDAVGIVAGIAEQKGWKTERIHSPFRWSEDFGHFTRACKGAMIGLGAGLKHPGLHNPDYDFPDELLETGVELFKSIYHELIP